SVAVEGGQGEDLVALGDVGHVGPDGGDDARQLVGGNRRQPADRPGQLVAGDPRSMDAHQRLVGTGARDIELFDGKPVVVPTYGAHQPPPGRVFLTNDNI